MKYLDAFKAQHGNSVVSVGSSPHKYANPGECTDHTALENINTIIYYIKEPSSTRTRAVATEEVEGRPPTFSNSRGKPPTKTTETASETAKTDSVVFGGDKWRRPPELATWPVEYREKWGRLANQFEDEGISFPESERRAFQQVKAERALTSACQTARGRAPRLAALPTRDA
jgi:hypothetical protein